MHTRFRGFHTIAENLHDNGREARLRRVVESMAEKHGQDAWLRLRPRWVAENIVETRAREYDPHMRPRVGPSDSCKDSQGKDEEKRNKKEKRDREENFTSSRVSIKISKTLRIKTNISKTKGYKSGNFENTTQMLKEIIHKHTSFHDPCHSELADWCMIQS